MNKQRTIKKQIAIAITAALLALPLGISPALADTDTSIETTSTTTSTDAASPDTSDTDTTSTDATDTDTTNTDVANSETEDANVEDANDENTNVEDTDDEDTDDEDTDDEDADDEDANDEDANDEDTNTEDTDTEESEDTPVVDEEGNEVDAATWLSDLIGKLKMALTFDPARKCELNEEQALAKLARAQELMTEEKTEEAQIALSEYTDKITKAQEYLDQIEDPESEEAQKLSIALTKVNHNNIKVLGELLDKLPPQAAQKLALNVVRSMEKAVTKMEKQEAKHAVATEPETTPEATPTTDRKMLEKQAKVALKEFKKSLKQKGTIHLENDEDQDNETEDQEDIASTQPTSVTVAPAELQPAQTSVHSSEKDKEHGSKQDEKRKAKDGDKKEDHKRDNR